jgi:hypothetical protein
MKFTLSGQLIQHDFMKFTLSGQFYEIIHPIRALLIKLAAFYKFTHIRADFYKKPSGG